MEFSLAGYNISKIIEPSFWPSNYSSYNGIDKKKYIELINKQKGNGVIPIGKTFRELKKRVGDDYFFKVYPIQKSALSYSKRSFPCYRFIMAEIMTDDWLAIVDWHKKFCRDHALHQPLTAYIVRELLGFGESSKSFKIGNKNLLDLAVEEILKWDKTKYIKEYLVRIGMDCNHFLFDDNYDSREIWKRYFYETCVVAATFHDIGYPWQYINRLSTKLNTVEFSLDNSANDAEYIYNCFKDRLILYPFFDYSNPINLPCNWKPDLLNLISDSLANTHGFSGALGFLYLNDFIKSFPCKKTTPFEEFRTEWAALGIMMHDMRNIYQGRNERMNQYNNQFRIEFDKDPLSFIITLADTLEEFERPSIDFSYVDNKLKDQGKFFNYKCYCEAAELTYDLSELKISYHYNDIKAFLTKQSFVKKEEKALFDPNNGYLDISSIGIKKISMTPVFV